MSVTTLRPGPSRPRTAFVLGGGGNLGATQIGMLQALYSRGIRPDVLVGSSVGAVNASALAADPSDEGLDAMCRVWLDPATGHVFSSGKLGGPWQLLRKGPSMAGNERLREMLDGKLAGRRFEDLEVPLHVVATSLRTARERWFDSGDVAEAVLASAALPAVLPPVEIDGDLYIDGGVVDNVPIVKAVQLGVERVMVLHVGNFARPRPDPQRPLDVLLQAFSISRSYRFEAEKAADHGVEVLILPAVDPGSLKRNDFSRSGRLIDQARRVAGAWLDEQRLAVG